MESTASFAYTDSAIGLVARKRSEGPESDLVERFLEAMVPTLASPPDRVALFLEPALETLFPDVVICVYDPRRFEDWTAQRSALQVRDLKVLHHLHLVSKTDIPCASAQLGIEQRQLIRTFETLHDAGLARQGCAYWKPVGLEQVFGIKRLIAVEAKISNWHSAFRQASTNKWFASETYVLTPVARPSVQTMSRAEKLGVGIYSFGHGTIRVIHESPILGLPTCYASWLFNEWIGRSFAGIVSSQGEIAHASA